jgi:hypothetical protein
MRFNTYLVFEMLINGPIDNSINGDGRRLMSSNAAGDAQSVESARECNLLFCMAARCPLPADNGTHARTHASLL